MIEVCKGEFKLLASHMGHKIEMVGYGKNGKPPWHNISVECLDCDAVIMDWEVEKKTVVTVSMEKKRGSYR